MKKIYLLIISIFLFYGCATIAPVQPEVSVSSAVIETGNRSVDEIVEEVMEHPDLLAVKVDEVSGEILPPSGGLENVDEKNIEEYAGKKGVVFAKTDFLGVLKAPYVSLLIQKEEDPESKFQLVIGDKSEALPFKWDVKSVSSGYFFIELPIGHYKISSISIPVGSTLATEEVNVVFEVKPFTVVYIGTLKMIGTKEKIRLGGVPVIRPGFEYTVEVLNEVNEAGLVFKEKYPNVTNYILTGLMKVQSLGPTE